MKKIFLLMLLLPFIVKGQSITDSIIGKQFFLTKRVWVVGSIESNNATVYRVNDIWTATEVGNFWDKAHLLSLNSISFFNERKEMLLLKVEDAIKYFDDRYSIFSIQDYKVLNKIYKPAILSKLMSCKTWLGMNSTQLQISKGFPTSINTTKTRRGTRQQWVYNHTYTHTEYYYFENGALTTIQD